MIAKALSVVVGAPGPSKDRLSEGMPARESQDCARATCSSVALQQTMPSIAKPVGCFLHASHVARVLYGSR